ncbi:O-antigen translocase [Mesorhizobium sp. RP14(2022)]|uniref:O-antigen translocase n=1 Tax=Mesorhizobium liriopis TaxID=2953882 RepID=A0ABT1C2Q0_9HYPH|nr:O-antigen translocase [Mesorhizobium liriopis]MCO6049112.1 O-antigen translocase [Mesorhizobium liriopis]
MSVSTGALEAAPTPERSRSHLHILKSTAVIGGSSLINILLSIVRTKAMAVLLGPSGVGLMGLFGAILDLAHTATEFGVQQSGVRQIAEAVGSGNETRIARTALVLRRVSLVLGVTGALVLLALSAPIASFSFDTPGHAAGVALLSLALFCRVVSAGQAALIQGLRRIGDLARISVLGGLASTVVGVPLVYVLGENGVALSILAMSIVSLLASWWFARKVSISPVRMRWSETSAETVALFRLGIVFMASGLLTTGAAYAIRLIVLQNGGIEAAGLFQSAWALGGLYAGFILQAMGTDFYPRLTAAAHDNEECNRLVNEQAHVSMLLAGPGLLGTLTLAPLIMLLFYSPSFVAAADLLRWICLGMMLRIVAWPMGYIVLAKGAGRIFFWTEVAATLVQVGLAWLLVPWLGPVGAGIAFFGLYVWHGILIYLLVRRLTGYRMSGENIRLGLIFLPAASLIFSAFHLLSLPMATVLGLLVTFAATLHALRQLLRQLPDTALPVPLRNLVAKLI